MNKGNGCSFSSVSSISVFSSAIFVVSLILVCLLYVIYRSSRPLCKRASYPVVILLRCLIYWQLALLQKDRFNPRFYIAATTDNMSLQKAQLLENSLTAEILMRQILLQNASRVTDTAQFMKIYRSREVGQSYITSVWTTLIAMVHAQWLMIRIRPEVVPRLLLFALLLSLSLPCYNELILYCYCPDTSQWTIPLCAIAFVFKVLGIRWSSIFYVESIARVRRLLSGLLLYKLWMADQLFVQWAQLKRQYPRATYVGRLM